MKKTIINIKGLNIKNYKRDENAYDLHILIELNGEKKILAKRYSYAKPEDIVKDVIRTIKNKFGNYDFLEDDPLQQTMIIMQNLEDVEEKMINFIKRVHDRIRDFKSHKLHTNYINLYNSIDGLSTNF
jgi:hypothetical protein